jgi:NADPH-dependent 2,4-dienoyl-CoA reductase/sulfur reductase-like enzyme
MTERLAVVGGDAAGMSAAATARRRRGPGELEIVAFERGGLTSYSACGIPYYVGDLFDDVDELIARSPEEHRRRGIDVRTRHDVVAIDTAARTLTVRDLDVDPDATSVEPYDQLVIATGGRPKHPAIPGIDARGVFGIQHVDDGIALRQAIEARGARRAVVVGGGYIGLEMAESMLRRGLEVVLVDRGRVPMHTLDEDMGDLVADALRELGVDVRLGEAATAVESEDGQVTAVVTAQGRYPADVVVLGLGTRPAGELAAAAGIEVGASGGISTDDHQRTSADGVFAAGDCVEVHHRLLRRPVAIALGTHANKQGRVVGINATGGDAVFAGVIGTAVAKVCTEEIARTGLTQREADGAGFDTFVTVIDATSRAGYLPEATPIRVRFVTERRTGRLLGAQIVGREGAAKRIDVLAACIWNQMTVEEILSLDLGYAPPFSPLWDPVLVAARAAAGNLE